MNVVVLYVNLKNVRILDLTRVVQSWWKIPHQFREQCVIPGVRIKQRLSRRVLVVMKGLSAVVR